MCVLVFGFVCLGPNLNLNREGAATVIYGQRLRNLVRTNLFFYKQLTLSRSGELRHTGVDFLFDSRGEV